MFKGTVRTKKWTVPTVRNSTRRTIRQINSSALSSRSQPLLKDQEPSSVKSPTITTTTSSSSVLQSVSPSDNNQKISSTQNSLDSDHSYITDEELRQFVPYIGRGSHYTRRIVSHYVKKLDNGGRLCRADFQRTNEITTAKKQNKQLAQKIYSEDLFNFTSVYTYKILSILQEIVSVEELQRDSLMALSSNINASDNNSAKLLKMKKRSVLNGDVPHHYYKEVPPIPIPLNEETFEKYIHTLTHSTFYYKKASKVNGLISDMLLELLRFDNKVTKNLRLNINVFNDAIYFYSKKNDFATMRELYYQMHKLHLIPNTKTLNLFISVLKNLQKQPHGTPAIEKLYKFMETFKFLNLKPDLTTFTLIYNALPETKSKILLIELMNNLKIPITSGLLRSVITDLLNKMLADEVIQFFKTNGQFSLDDLDIVCADLIINGLLKEEKYEQAWSFLMDNAAFKPRLATMNTFLRHFGNMERIDLALSAFNTFKQVLKVRPNIESYHHLIRCAVKTGYHKNWRELVRILYHESVEFSGSNFNEISSYWLTRARARSLADQHNSEMLRFKQPLSDEELALAEEIKQVFIWKDLKLVSDPLKSDASTPEYKALWLKLGYTSGKPLPGPKLTVEGDRRHLGVKKRYLKMIKHKAIMDLYRSRVDAVIYDPQTALYKKLKQRNIFPDEKVLE